MKVFGGGTESMDYFMPTDECQRMKSFFAWRREGIGAF